MVILMETHTSGPLTKRIAKKCGLDKYFIVDVRGQSWGLWCLWDSTLWNIQIISSTSQLIHIKLQFKDEPPWLMFACYGSPHFAYRQDLWRQLRDIHIDVNYPWAIIGDLNAMISTHEGKGPPLDNPMRQKLGLINTINQLR